MRTTRCADQVVKARATSRRHHDQIDLLSLSHVDDFTVGRSHPHQSCHFHASGLGFRDDLRELLRGLALQILYKGRAKLGGT